MVVVPPPVMSYSAMPPRIAQLGVGCLGWLLAWFGLVIKISPAKPLVLSLILSLIVISTTTLFTLAFSRNAQQGLQFKLVIYSGKQAHAHRECHKGLIGWTQQQRVQMFSKLMSSQLEPELHSGAGEVVVAVVWVAGGKCLKIRQQRDLQKDPVRSHPKGLAGDLLHLLSHAGPL